MILLELAGVGTFDLVARTGKCNSATRSFNIIAGRGPAQFIALLVLRVVKALALHALCYTTGNESVLFSDVLEFHSYRFHHSLGSSLYWRTVQRVDEPVRSSTNAYPRFCFCLLARRSIYHWFPLRIAISILSPLASNF